MEKYCEFWQNTDKWSPEKSILLQWIAWKTLISWKDHEFHQLAGKKCEKYCGITQHSLKDCDKCKFWQRIAEKMRNFDKGLLKKWEIWPKDHLKKCRILTKDCWKNIDFHKVLLKKMKIFTKDCVKTSNFVQKKKNHSAKDCEKKLNFNKGLWKNGNFVTALHLEWEAEALTITSWNLWLKFQI